MRIPPQPVSLGRAEEDLTQRSPRCRVRREDRLDSHGIHGPHGTD